MSEIKINNENLCIAGNYYCTFTARLQPRDKAAMLVEKLIQNVYIQKEF